MNIRTMVGIAIIASICSGCAGTKVHFADAPLDKLDLSRGYKVTGRASGLHLFGLIPIGVNNRQVRAYEMLKEEAGDDYITNIRIQDSWKFVVIGEKYGTTLTATAYPGKNRSVTPTARRLTEILDELKSLHDKAQLSDVEYEAARKKAIDNYYIPPEQDVRQAY